MCAIGRVRIVAIDLVSSAPWLLLVSGPPGAGKSTLAKALAADYGAVLLDKDCIDDPFSPNRRDAQYREQVEPRVLAAMLQLATLNLGVGHPVILDAPWTHLFLNEPEWIDRIQETARATAARLVILECLISETTLRQRMTVRGFARDAERITDAGWREFRRLDRLGEANPLPHIAIDAEQSAADVFRSARAALQKIGLSGIAAPMGAPQ